jgi:hypothetical protein
MGESIPRKKKTNKTPRQTKTTTKYTLEVKSIQNRALDVAEHLLRMHKALDSISNTSKQQQ